MKKDQKMTDRAGIPHLQWNSLESLRDQLGDAFYVVDVVKFEQNYLDLLGEFKKHYPNSNIGYSYKTNYMPDLCRRVLDLGGYAEVVSEMEFDFARRIGVPADRIIFNGPYKSERSFRGALIGGATVNLDSARDLGFLLKLADDKPHRTFSIALRCNFELSEGAVSRFGFDIDGDMFRNALKAIADSRNVNLVGLHCHFPDRDKSSYEVRVEKLLALADKVFGDVVPKFLNIGGGFFGEIPVSLKKAFSIKHVTFSEYAQVVASAMARRYGVEPGCPELLLEPGTAIVANTMRFVCRVADVKTVRGKTFATVAGSIFNISPVARNLSLPQRVIARSGDAQSDARRFDIVGFTCIEGDVMSRDVSGDVSVGDFIEYSNVGSYSIVMKPPFILPNFPIIQFSSATDPRQWTLVKKAETVDYIFQNYTSY